MGFVEIEQAGKRMLEQFPVVKRSAKRLYQILSVMTSNERIKSEGNIVRVSPADEYEYFYGYYDKSPWDAADRYIICIKVKQTYKSVAPNEPGIVGLIDTQNDNNFLKIGITHSWNVQQSCMAQWMGPDFKSRIIYNDFRDGKYCSVIYSLIQRKEEKVLSMPVYDVAKDGSFALSLDFSRLHRMRPGYGYSNLQENTKDELCPDKPCIWKIDINTGQITELLKYTDMTVFEPNESMNGAEHKVNHLMISPNCKRFMVLHRWFQKGRKHTRLVTVNVDKTEMYNLSDEVFVSHCYWKNDDEILSFLRKKENGDHYYLLRDKTQEYQLYWPELNTDGHCSYSPDGSMVITDTYPNRKRIASVYLCTEGDNRSQRIARVFAPFKYDNDCRCDLHPRWNRAGDKVCIDSVHEGKRGLYVIPIIVGRDMKSVYEKNDTQMRRIKPLRILMIDTAPMVYDGITTVILNYITHMDRSNVQIDVMAINEVETSIKRIITSSGGKFYVLNTRNTDQFKYLRQLSSLIRRNGYEVVHVHGNSCTLAIEMLAAKLGGAKVRCPHSHNTKCVHKRAHKLLKPLFNLCYTHGFACGYDAGKWLYQNRDFVILKNGTDTSRYKFNPVYRKEYRKKLEIEGKIAVGNVAHFTSHKNHKFLIDVFKDVVEKDSRYILVLVGDGRYRDSIEEKVRTLNLQEHVIFTGITTEIPQILSAMDMMVLPSLYEGLPCVAIEWQASGLPSIFADTITEECKMSDLITFVPLEQKKWVNAILNCECVFDRMENSEKAIASIKSAGYDITFQANYLKEQYLKYVEED